MTLSQEQIAEVVRQDLERLGCTCEATVEASDSTEHRAFGITGHRGDCPAVAHYSRPENQPQ